MKREDFDALGDRMKLYEESYNHTLIPGLPIMIRLDGRAFHTFTKGLTRPYDERMSMAMRDTTKYLLSEFNAHIGYCQSDEISLVLVHGDNPLFSGRIQKIASILASSASVKFNSIIQETIPEKKDMFPLFDARVFNVPNLDIVTEQFIWREADATRNSLTMAAHAHFPHKELHGVGFKGKHDLLHSVGVNWNDYPDFFKKGSYFTKVEELRVLTPTELERIPEKWRPSGPILRSNVVEMVLPPLKEVDVAKDLLFKEIL